MDDFASSIADRCKEIIEGNQHFRYLTRSEFLQADAVQELSSLRLEITQEKSRYIEALDESQANLLLGYECVVDGLISEIQMCILLKQGNPDTAWDSLISSQQNYSAAVRAHDQLTHFTHQARRLEYVERLMFPPQSFMSPGYVATVHTCTICSQDYSECEHIKGKPYMGEFCYVELGEIEMEEVSLVYEPANKHARVVVIGTEDGMRNCMTWEIVPN